MSTVISTLPTTYIEISPSALALATDEVRALFRERVATRVAKRLGDAAKQLAREGAVALRSDYDQTDGIDLRLVDG